MTNEVDLILERAGKLSAEETVTLVQELMTELRRKIKTKESSGKEKKGKGLIYGEFKNTGRRMSTEEDFKLTEYHLNEGEWK